MNTNTKIKSVQSNSQSRSVLLASTALAMSLGMIPIGTAAVAQEPVADELRDEELQDVIVVTGRAGAGALNKLDASYAITTVDEAEIREIAPQNTVDFLRVVPGLWVESSGGTANGNIRARGIPLDGFGALGFHEDGAPIQHDPGQSWRNVDQIIRLDETIERVEAVRGGTAAIFGSNSPGGLVNFITKKAGDEAEGVLKYTWGDYSLHRVDFFYGAPLGDGWGIAVGGFYRSSDTVRDPGFTADQGGQFRVTLSKEFERGRVDVGVRYLDDNTTFLLPVPIAVGANGEVGEIPGFDPSQDNTYGPELLRITHRTANGERRTNLADGTDINHTALTASVEYDLGDGWMVSNKARYSDSDLVRNAVFPGTPVSAMDFLDDQRADALAAFPGATDVQLIYSTTGDPFDVMSANGNGLVMGGGWNNIKVPTEEFNNTLTLSKIFDIAGQSHDVAVGFYFANVRHDRDRVRAAVLTEVRDQPRLLDVVAVDAVGDVVGSVTANGVTRFGNKYEVGGGDLENYAIFASDEWAITDRLRLDAGVRYERSHYRGAGENKTSVDLGDATTLADDNVLAGTSVFEPHDRTFDDVAWSVGASYSLTDNMSIYGRYTDAFRLPDPTSFLFSPDRTDVRSQKIDLAEAGIKIQADTFDLYGNFFYTNYGDVRFTNNVVDISGGFTETQEFADIRTYGVELEGFWAPVEFFDIGANITWQDSSFNDFTFSRVVGGSLVEESFDGNRPIRIPELALLFRPGVNLLDGRLRIYGEVQHFTDRFADAANEVTLPAYTTANAGLVYGLKDNLDLRVYVANLNNSQGLTEGNPRAGQIVSADVGSAVALGRPILGRNVRVSLRLTF